MGVCKAGRVSFWPVSFQVEVDRCLTFTCQDAVAMKGVPITLTCVLEDSKKYDEIDSISSAPCTRADGTGGFPLSSRSKCKPGEVLIIVGEFFISYEINAASIANFRTITLH